MKITIHIRVHDTGLFANHGALSKVAPAASDACGLRCVSEFGIGGPTFLTYMAEGRRPIPPNPTRWQANPDPASIHVPGLDTTASVHDQIEQRATGHFQASGS